MQTPLPLLVLVAAAVALQAGCATTSVESAGLALQRALCSAGEPKPSAVLYWKPQWRADQKEPQSREVLAQRGIERFAAQAQCLRFTEVQRLSDDGRAPGNDELVQRAAAARGAPEWVMLVVVRELGPRLLLGLPVLVEGGTEVVIDVRLLRLSGAQVLLDLRTQWRNGGTFVIKGVGSLEADLDAALRAALSPQPPAGRLLPSSRSPGAQSAPS